MKLAIFLSKSVLVTKLACFNVTLKFYTVKLLNSGLVISLSWLGTLFSTSPIFVFKTIVVTKPLASGIFCIKISIFSSKFSLSVLYELMWINVVKLEISLNYLLLFLVCVCFFLLSTTSFSTTALIFFKPTGKVFNLPTSKSYMVSIVYRSFDKKTRLGVSVNKQLTEELDKSTVEKLKTYK